MKGGRMKEARKPLICPSSSSYAFLLHPSVSPSSPSLLPPPHDPPITPDIFGVLVSREDPAGPAPVRAQISRQFYRGERWYVVRDPAGNQFHRLSDPAYRFVGLLDGSRTVEEAWDLAGGMLEDDAPDPAGSHPDPQPPVQRQPDRRRRYARCDGAPPPAQAALQAEDAEPADERPVPAHPALGPGPLPRPLDAAGKAGPEQASARWSGWRW